MTNSVRIALVDDHLLFRRGIEAILRASDSTEIVFETGEGQDFLDWLSEKKTPPEVVLLDIEMPGINGIQMAEELRKTYPGIRIIILSMHFRENLIAGLVEKGVHGYLPKNCDPGELLNAISTVQRTGFYFNEAVLKAMQKNMSGVKKRAPDVTMGFGITPREKEVLELICRENTTAEIAEKLCLSMRTVDGHRNNLLQKTGAKNSAGLVLFAVRHRIIDPWF